MTQSRQLAAIMFADIVGYTALMQHNESEAVEKLHHFKEELALKTNEFNGEIVQFYGDGCLITFTNSVNALSCAKKMQEDFRGKLNVPVRIGIHLGDIVMEDGNVFGDSINISSRIESMGVPGTVLISEALRNQVKNKPEFILTSLGKFEFKNVDEPIEIFALSNEGFPVPDKNKLVGKFKLVNHKKRKRWLVVYTAIFMLLVIASWYLIKNYSKQAIQSVDSLVVLPVSNLTGSDENKYIAEGLQDALITELSHIKSLRVISRTSAKAYENTQKSARQIAEELNVDAFIESSLMKADDSIKFNVQLIKVKPEEDHLWAGIFDHSLGDILIMVSNVTKQISESIRAVLSPREKELISNKKEVDPELVRLYLKGKYYLDQYTREGFKSGLQYLNEVIEKDPSYGPAYAALSIGYGDLAHLPSAPQDAFPRAKALAERALKLDPTLVEANTAMAESHLYNTWNFKTAENYFKAALALDSNYAPALSNYGWYLDLTGNNVAAEYYLKKAADLDPLAPIYRTWLAWWYWVKKRYDEGIFEAKRVLQFSPDFPVANWVLGGIYADIGKFDEAILLSTKAKDVRPRLIDGLVIAYIKAGKREQAIELIDSMEKGPFNAFSLCLIYAELGDTEEAVKWAKVVYNIRHMFTPWLASGFFANTLSKHQYIKDLFKPITDSIPAS